MSDKIVNVYVGECFQEGGQAGGEGKTYGLSLSGNKLKLVENGQQSEVDLPAGGGSGNEVTNYDVEAFNMLMYMLAKAKYNPDKIYSSPAGQYTATLVGEGSIDDPYYINFVFIDKELSRDRLFISDVYNHKTEFLKDSADFKSMMAYPMNFVYGDTLVPYDKTNGSFDVSKLPKGLRAYKLKAVYAG